MSAYPKLVLPAFCKTPIDVCIELEELNVYGEPTHLQLGRLKCNWQDKAVHNYTEHKKEIVATGKALFDGDICPSVSNISAGYVTVFGRTRNIVRGTKARNPDGTVNYTCIEVE